MKKRLRLSKSKIVRKKTINWKVLVACFAIVFFTAFIGSIVNDAGTSGWYNSVKPSITPPSYIFPIVWTLLFIMIAISLYYSWTIAGREEKKVILVFFGANLFFNSAWSVLFFGLKDTSSAFFDLLFLWISIAALILYLWNDNKKAALMLVPYLLWVSFAGVLNYLIAF
jgi:tryptophan-rich sensory protein